MVLRTAFSGTPSAYSTSVIIAPLPTAGTPAAPGPVPPPASNGVIPDFLKMIGFLLGKPEQIQIPADEKTGGAAAGDRQNTNATSRKDEKDTKEPSVSDTLPCLYPQTVNQPPPALLLQALELSINRSPEENAATSGDRPPASAPSAAGLGTENPPRLPAAVPDLAFRLKIFGIELPAGPSPVAANQPLLVPDTPLSGSAVPGVSNQVQPGDSREPSTPATAPPAAEPAPVTPPNLRGQASNPDSRHSRAAQDDSPAEIRSPQGDGVPAPRFDLRSLEPESPVAPGRHAAIPAESPQVRSVDGAPLPPSRTEPVRELSLRLPDANQGKVDVHILNQGGRIQVDVRASDAGLAQALRTNVDDLVSQLHDRGYRAEADPLNGVSGAAALDSSGQQLRQDADRHGDAEPGGRPPQHPQQQHQQQDQQRRRQSPSWLQYFYETDSQPAGRSS